MVEIGKQYTLDFDAWKTWYQINVSPHTHLLATDVITVSEIIDDGGSAGGFTGQSGMVWTGFMPQRFLLPVEA